MAFNEKWTYYLSEEAAERDILPFVFNAGRPSGTSLAAVSTSFDEDRRAVESRVIRLRGPLPIVIRFDGVFVDQETSRRWSPNEVTRLRRGKFVDVSLTTFETPDDSFVAVPVSDNVVPPQQPGYSLTFPPIRSTLGLLIRGGSISARIWDPYNINTARFGFFNDFPRISFGGDPWKWQLYDSVPLRTGPRPHPNVGFPTSFQKAGRASVVDTDLVSIPHGEPMYVGKPGGEVSRGRFWAELYDPRHRQPREIWLVQLVAVWYNYDDNDYFVSAREVEPSAVVFDDDGELAVKEGAPDGDHTRFGGFILQIEEEDQRDPIQNGQVSPYATLAEENTNSEVYDFLFRRMHMRVLPTFEIPPVPSDG